jgi:acylphosphatase
MVAVAMARRAGTGHRGSRVSAYAIHHVVIRGRVQGVGYRAWVEYTALDRGLEGWVRNRRDGSVEAVFAGPPEAVDAMVAACRHGPPGARVDVMDELEASPAALAPRRPGERFSVLPSL